MSGMKEDCYRNEGSKSIGFGKFWRDQVDTTIESRVSFNFELNKNLKCI